MKLTTKRNRWFFWRELFLYMIPMILIVGAVDVFVSFMRCPLHPEWSAPCSVNWLIAAVYGVFLLLAIIFAIISSRALRKVKKQIETEFTEAIENHIKEQETQEKEKSEEKKLKVAKPRKVIAKSDKKSEKKSTTDKKSSTKKTIAKK